MSVSPRPSLRGRLGRKRRGLLAAAAAVGLAAPLCALPVVDAGALPLPTVTLAQSSAALNVGQNDTLTATVTQSGTPVADGTQIEFNPAYGLVADHLYSGIAAASGGGYWRPASNRLRWPPVTARSATSGAPPPTAPTGPTPTPIRSSPSSPTRRPTATGW